MKKYTIFAVIALISVVVGAGGYYLYQQTQVLSAEEAKNNALTFINENLLQPGTTAEFVSVGEENGLYKIVVKVGENEPEVYVSKNGKFLFIQPPIDISASIEQEQNQNENANEEIPTSEKPEVELYVMSFCPYGNRAEDTMLPAYNLLKDKVDWKMHYIVNVDGNTVSSLHGQPEVDQNEREACVLKNNGLDKWWQFTTYVNTNCGSDGSCWQAAAQNSGLSASEISNCVSSQGLALMTQEAAATDEAGASGSPTLFINGTKTNEVYKYGNSQAYLDAICSAFANPPQECSESLPTSSSASTASGSCN